MDPAVHVACRGSNSIVRRFQASAIACDEHNVQRRTCQQLREHGSLTEAFHATSLVPAFLCSLKAQVPSLSTHLWLCEACSVT